MECTDTEEIYWLNKDSRKFLEKDYLLPGETPEQRLEDIAKGAEKLLGIKGFASKFLKYLKKGYYSLSSPIWANSFRARGLPISCFGSYIADDLEEITANKYGEVAMMTKFGGGTSAYFGDLRGRGEPISSGGTSTGAVHFMELYESLMNVVSQGSVRRGSFAAYLNIDHKDIEEFLKIRADGNCIQNLSMGVCISDKWMEELVAGDKAKRRIWGQVIKKRFETGYPYIFFTDTVNNAAPKIYKKTKRKIHASNLCSEIMLSTSEKESFVCNLSSINLEHWDEIKDTDAIETMIYFLDAIQTEFINKTEGSRYLESARNFAINQRALGLGVLGFHGYLQKNMIPLESMESKFANSDIFSTLRAKCDKATEELAVLFGAAPIYEGTDIMRRNVTTMAIAPTTSSSFILGQVSPSIEPNNSNYFVKDLAKGKFSWKNPWLIKLLKELDKDTAEVWKEILNRGGSVQHLDFLTREQKDVFKTFSEVSQKELVILAAQRQKWIDQGQSLNITVSPKTRPKDVSDLIIFGWEQKIKTFYYQRSANPSQELARSILNCASCEG